MVFMSLQKKELHRSGPHDVNGVGVVSINFINGYL